MPLPPITYAEQAEDVLARACDLLDAGTPFALVVSVRIEGGSAREVGSLAVVSRDGDMVGYMSNGCIDRDLILQAQEALAEGAVRSPTYGAGSPFMDLRLPCGGTLGLVIDPAPDAAALRAAHGDLVARRPARLSVGPTTGVAGPEGAAADAIVIRYAPKPRLVLAGRGAVFRATAALTAHAGMGLCLASPEEDDLVALADLPTVAVQRLTAPDQGLTLPLDAHTSLLTLFHDHEWEPAILATAARSEARFIGAMGSRRTHEMRLQELTLLGLTAAERARVTGPIGLVPSLRNASLIAVSALAQVAAVLPPAQVVEVTPN
ncbi:XdhC family protein [Jannaschia pohangensis]|uniref:Xanthine dehydrogenase accessory factor n=1 Tax=Jannaschia pohangensis TaxID=390807 RepID=A0A1I3IR39_9RHOB|nr:XdhC family protein [Jannaschia pohangensis]SFI50448.1 xanthine dehydrogenase accessory factor [Jannaschia pohangensis]